MKLVLWSLTGVVALVLIVLVIGLQLPVHHVAAVQARYAAPPDSLYDVIADVSAGPQWRTGLERVEVVSAPGSPLRWRETADWGTLTFVRDQELPGRRIVNRIEDTDVGFGGTWTYELDSAGSGSRLRITEHGDVRNPFYRFMSRFVMGHHQGLETYARDVGRRFGEEVEVELE